MRKLTTILLFLFALSNAFANPVDEATAKTIGTNFLFTKTNSNKLGAISNLYLVYTAIDSLNSPKNPSFYIFNTSPSKGFVIVAADDNAQPILGYSNESNFDTANIPIQFNDWLRGYTRDVSYIIQHKINATQAVKTSWQELMSLPKKKSFGLFGSPSSVAPLVGVTWNQTAYYNQLCPSGTLTGCVATAMAQLMKYWDYPTKGTGYHSYTDTGFGVQSASFGNTTYQWASMPASLSATSTAAQVNAVATLIYQCGVSVNMKYSSVASSSYMVGGGYDAQYALKSFFGYNDSLHALSRANYSDSAWLDVIENELGAGRPILWDGHETSGLGHCFVADGYDANNFIHFNWGWSGQDNGYYSIDALNPAMYPAGFNSLEHILVDIKPFYAGYSLSLDSTVNSATVVGYGKPITVETNIINSGNASFNGSFCAAIFDTASNFTNFIQILNTQTLGSNSTFKNGITFTNIDSTPINPGTYTVYIYYMAPGGDWQNLVSNGNFSNYITITVINSSIVPDTIYITKNETVCSSQLPYSWNGNLYNQAGTYTAFISNINDTTTIGTLNLSVKNSSNSITTVDICPSKLPFKWNGTKYTSGGTYTKNFTNSVGCDSITTLVLNVDTITPTKVSDTVSGCGPVVYNGKTYTSNTVLLDTLKTTDGCDSVYRTVTIMLNATVYPKVTVATTANNITQGTPVTFTATATNAGTVNVYQWRKNSSYITNATSSTYTTDSLKNNDTISCVFITVNGCGKVYTAVSNEIIITVFDLYTVSGNIINPLGKGISRVLVGLNNNDSLFSCSYDCLVQSNDNYTIRPSKNNDVVKANGVSVLDVLLIQNNILGKVLLGSPYKLIAADVNNDGMVSVLDVIYIKQLILGIDTTFPSNRLWAFVDSAYQFANPANPFPYKDSININSPSSNAAKQSFIGVKLGDVNYDWDVSILGIGNNPVKPIGLFYDIKYNNNQSEVRIPIKVKDFKDIAGFQFTLNFDASAIQLKSIDANLLNAQYNASKSSDGKISFLWNDQNVAANTLADSTILMELVFSPIGSTPDYTLGISSDITPIEAYDAGLKPHHIILTASKPTISSKIFTVYPNPGKDNVTISGNHINCIKVIDNLGRAVILKAFQDATNPTINVNGLPAGAYHLLIQTTDGNVNGVGFVKE